MLNMRFFLLRHLKKFPLMQPTCCLQAATGKVNICPIICSPLSFFGAEMLACKCYNPVDLFFQVLCFTLAFKLQIYIQSKSTWLITDYLEPSKDLFVGHRNTLFFFYCFIFQSSNGSTLRQKALL